MNSLQEKIKETVENMLTRMNFPGEVEVSSETEDIRVNIKTDEAGYLIGQEGNNLKSLQYLVRLIINKKIDEEENVQFILDVNNYRQQREQRLRQIADYAAQKVLLEKKPVALRPMTSFERRVIHTTLADHPSVTTESVDEDNQRKVIIKLK